MVVIKRVKRSGTWQADILTRMKNWKLLGSDHFVDRAGVSPPRPSITFFTQTSIAQSVHVLSHSSLNFFRAVTQAVGRWSYTAEANPRAICGGQNEAAIASAPSTSIFLCQWHFTNTSYPHFVHLPSTCRWTTHVSLCLQRLSQRAEWSATHDAC
jgi:hypothetical protein